MLSWQQLFVAIAVTLSIDSNRHEIKRQSGASVRIINENAIVKALSEANGTASWSMKHILKSHIRYTSQTKYGPQSGIYMPASSYVEGNR